MSPAEPEAPVICWLRRDMRLADNPALLAACETGQPVVLLYIHDDETPGKWRPGGASLWWLHHSLHALSESLARHDQHLILRKGEASAVLGDVIDEIGASDVFWNRLYDPAEIARDKRIKADLKQAGLGVESFPGNLAFEPWTRETGQGGPYKVYSPFRKACENGAPPADALKAPTSIQAPQHWPDSEDLVDWGFLPTRPDWAGGLRENWTPGEQGALDRFESFLDNGLSKYGKRRDYPAENVTSCLSPYLHFGEITPRQIMQRLSFLEEQGTNVAKFRSEVIWREFSHHLLYHFPDLPEKNWKSNFDGFPWAGDEDALRAWQTGQTGYPIVDAGMRELWHTGIMHNRIRMVVASFLIKHLLIHWKAGADWFWDTLVDADLANNAASWQWVAGSGADAAPYFRIFNPIKQGQDYDPDGDYTRRWVPELSDLPNKWLQEPWSAPADVLDRAGVKLGETYPKPLVDHPTARKRALDAYEEIKGK